VVHHVGDADKLEGHTAVPNTETADAPRDWARGLAPSATYVTGSDRPNLSSLMLYVRAFNPIWIETATVPVVVQADRLFGRKKWPRAQVPWGLDSGSLARKASIIDQVDQRQYGQLATFVHNQVGQLQWAAVQDWPCEDEALKQTGMSVNMHQNRTVWSYLDLREKFPDVPWMPILHGRTREDYFDHMGIWDKHGVDIQAALVVGVGSICKRDPLTVARILRLVSRNHIAAHAFGADIRAIKTAPMLSCDSWAWQVKARYNRIRLPGCTKHQVCSNCLRYATQWHGEVLSGGDR
jgi:hypothetical protein